MTACIQQIHKKIAYKKSARRSNANPTDAQVLTSFHVRRLKELYLLWFGLHLREAGGVHHRFGSPERVYEALPLRRQTHETALHRVVGRVHPVLEVPGGGDLQPPLLLLLPLEHPDSLLETRVCLIITPQQSHALALRKHNSLRNQTEEEAETDEARAVNQTAEDTPLS